MTDQPQTGSATAVEDATRQDAPPLAVDEDAGPDPLAGIPAEVRERVGAYDFDAAGGCG